MSHSCWRDLSSRDAWSVAMEEWPQVGLNAPVCNVWKVWVQEDGRRLTPSPTYVNNLSTRLVGHRFRPILLKYWSDACALMHCSKTCMYKLSPLLPVKVRCSKSRWSGLVSPVSFPAYLICCFYKHTFMDKPPQSFADCTITHLCTWPCDHVSSFDACQVVVP